MSALAAFGGTWLKSRVASEKVHNDAAGELVDDLRGLFLAAVERSDKSEADRASLHVEVSRLTMLVKQLQKENEVQALRIAELERLLLRTAH